MFKIYNKLCTGCRVCELVCSHQKIAGFNPSIARIRVESTNITKVNPVTCRQCKRPKCVASCDQGALTQDPETRVITLKENLCNQCGACIGACPFKAIYVHPKTKMPLICDLCNGEPACVAFCPNKALVNC